MVPAGVKCKLMGGGEIEYTPEKGTYNPKHMGIAFHQVHKAEEEMLIKKLTALSPNCRFLHKPSDQLNILISADNVVTPLVLLALARDAFIVKPSFTFDCSAHHKIVAPGPHEVGYFPKKAERSKSMQVVLKDLKLAIDIFGRSHTHIFLGDPILEHVIAEMGGKLVRRNTDADFIISDKNEKLASSTIFKKVDYRWLLDSLLKNALLKVTDYYF